MPECLKIFRQFGEDNPNESDLGGKAYSLVKLSALNINVPKFFVVTSDYFISILKQNNSLNNIQNIIKKLNLDNIKKSSVKIIQIINELKFLDEDEIFNCFESLNCDTVSVRSSAIGEDGGKNSWAGMFESFLFIDKQNLLESIKKVWASEFSVRALMYMYHKKLTNSLTPMAVIVQEMVDSQFAGVAFSANPLNGGNGNVIEYVSGQGEGLVSGKTTPKRLIFNSIDQIKQCDFPLKLITKIIEILKMLKNEYKSEIDIEWAIDNREVLYILQCRPITTIDENLKVLNKIEKKKWELYVKRPFAYNFEVFQSKICSKMEEILGFNVFPKNYIINNGFEFISLDEKKRINKSFEIFHARDKNFFDKYKKTLSNLIKHASKYNQYLENLNFEIIDLTREIYRFKDEYIRIITPTFARPDDYLQNLVYKLLETDMKLEQKTISQLILNCVERNKKITSLKYAKEISDFNKIMFKYRKKLCIDTDIELHKKKYAWMKNPLTTGLSDYTKEDYLQRLADSALIDVKKSFVNDVGFKVDKNLPNETKRMLDYLIDFVYFRTKITETSDYMYWLFKTKIIKRLSQILKIDEVDLLTLSCEEHILLLENVGKLKDFQAKIKERQLSYSFVWLNNKLFSIYDYSINEMIKNKLLPINEKVQQKNNVLKGDMVYPGRVCGKVKLINDSADLDNVRTDEILVLSMTTPECAIAMDKALGFITDEGGITCHASIIARELKKPCIVNTKCATALLKNGQEIVLNASDGYVIIKK